MQLRMYSDPVIKNLWHIKEPHKTNRCNFSKRISLTHDTSNGWALQVKNEFTSITTWQSVFDVAMIVALY